MDSYETSGHPRSRFHPARAVLLAAAIGVCVQGEVGAQRPGPAAASEVRRPAAIGWRLRTLDGTRLTLAEAASGPLLVNVWATWCRPCVAELASLQALHDSLAAEGVGFALVSPEPASVVRRFLERRRITIPVYVEDQPMPSAFGLRAVPTTYLIDRAGAIAATHRGAADWDTPGVRALLRTLLAEPHPRAYRP